jgi:hypothetical protein
MKFALPRNLFLIFAALVTSHCASTGSGVETTSEGTVPAGADMVAQTAPQETPAFPNPAKADADTLMATTRADTAGGQPGDLKKVVRCSKEKKTGSRIPKTYCRTVWEDERNREAGKAWVDSMQKNPTWNNGAAASGNQ